MTAGGGATSANGGTTARPARVARRLRVVVHDFSGHPFQVELSRELARRGHVVLHLHFAGFQTPKAALLREPGDPPTIEVEAITLDQPFAKYRLVRRLFQERAIGAMLARRIAEFRPDVVISANAPLDVQAGALKGARSQGSAFIFWLQDIYSEAIARQLNRKMPLLGRVIVRRFARLERRLLQRSDRVVVISNDFRPFLDRLKVDPNRVTTVENWAPLGEIEPRPKDNPWSREHDLHARPVILYSGTLGLKHNPALLLELSKRLRAERPEARLVVISEGLGADWLRERATDIPTLVQLPFQPFGRLADVLGAADVVVAILEPEAGAFSVPSKVLTYLAAGRAIVGAIPLANLAARLIEDNGAGIVVSSLDEAAFTSACVGLLDHHDERLAMGRRGRAYAEAAFDIRRIGDRFETLLMTSISADHGVDRRQVDPLEQGVTT